MLEAAEEELDEEEHEEDSLEDHADGMEKETKQSS